MHGDSSLSLMNLLFFPHNLSKITQIIFPFSFPVLFLHHQESFPASVGRIFLAGPENGRAVSADADWWFVQLCRKGRKIVFARARDVDEYAQCNFTYEQTGSRKTSEPEPLEGETRLLPK